MTVAYLDSFVNVLCYVCFRQM